VPEGARDGPLASRLRLLEGFLHQTELAVCAQQALQWFGEVLGASRSICLVLPEGDTRLVAVASYGLPGSAYAFSVLLEDRRNPLVRALHARRPVHVPAPRSVSDRRRRPSTPFEDAPFHVVPVGSEHADQAVGLLLFTSQARITPDERWFSLVFGRKLDQIHRQNVLIEGDRRQGRQRLLLYEQLKQASGTLERKIQAATADIAQQNEILRRQAIELEQASALKSQFLANMSHEFRTPLNAMLGYTSMLLQGVAGPVEPAVRRHLGRIESNGRHLLAIINEILDISRIEAGRMPLQVSTFRVSELVAEVRAEIEPIILRSKLSFSVSLSRGVGSITTDRQKVKQILLNLLSNALKFTQQGGVTISARRRARQRIVELSVADTGIGIAPIDQEQIFEDFRQLDNSPTRAYGGTGLGLSICRRLAHMLDGRISVRSAVGKGSIFTLTLPNEEGRR
jgi:signal transduction histidine kinase